MKRARKYIVAVIIAVGGIYASCTGLRFMAHRAACLKQEILTIENLSGVTFEVEYENCDTLAKEEFMNVYATKIDPAAGVLQRWKNRRTRELIFSYDPSRYDDPAPSITRPSQSRIQISIPRISSIVYQKREWAGMSVSYDIRHIEYPETPK